MNKFLEIFQHTHWFIEPDSMHMLFNSLKSDSSETAFEEKMKSFFRGEEDDSKSAYKVNNGVATVPLYGPIFPQTNFMTYLGYATALSDLEAIFEKIKSDDSVKKVILNCHSPGGVVFGVNSFAEYLSNFEKEVHTYVPGMCCSAAYWIASATDKIVVDDTALVGSIGVVCDVLNPEHDPFIEVTNRKSPNKRPNPTTEEGKGAIQDELDALANVFFSTVAENRNVSITTVENDFGKGGVLVGKDAMKAGMVDKVDSLKKFTEELLSSITSGVSGDYNSKDNNEENFMNLEELQAAHPKLWKEIEAKFASDNEASGEKAGEKAATDNTAALDQVNASIQSLTSAVKAMNDKVKALEKKDAVRDEQDMQNTANTIADSVLASTRLSSLMKTKVKNAVNYADYVSEEGSFDSAKFKEAVEAEADDYKKALAGRVDVEGAGTNDDVGMSDAMEDDSIDALLGSIGVEAAK